MSERLPPKVGDIVTVRTRLHGGEPGLVVDTATSDWRSRGGPRRWWARLQSINGSLYGAEGWYELHEFDPRPAPAVSAATGQENTTGRRGHDSPDS